MRITTTRARLLASTIIGGAAATLALATAAHAQTTTTQPGNAHVETTETSGQGQPATRVVGNSQGVNAAGDAASVGEVVITGSRISRRDYVANSPIVSVGPKALEATGSVTVETLINQLPAFTPSVTSTSNNPSNGGQANIDLRGLGTNRTLVLLDGRRVTPSNADGTVDVNTIPAALLDNIEIVTGGQSAAYGSDAIAGVVNFKLKKNFQGMTIDAQYGESERGDGMQESVAATIGGNFQDNRGNAVVSLAYTNRDGIFNAARPFSAVSGASSSTPYGRYNATGTNLPTQAAVTAVTGQDVARTSAFGFNNNGTLFSYTDNVRDPKTGVITGTKTNIRNYLGDSTSIDFATIPVNGTYNTGAINLLQLPITRYNLFTRGEYQITPHLKGYVQGSFTNFTATTQLAPSPASGNPAVGGTGFLVPVTNPFIPAGLRTILASRPNAAAPFLLQDRFTAAGPRVDFSEFNQYQLITGLSGDVPGMDWTYDVYGSYGRVTQNETQTGNISHAAVRTLLEAADGGASLCTGGYNIFGLQQISQSCRDYVTRTSKNAVQIEQRVVEANLQGGLFDLPAGRVKFAVGADYRSDYFNFVPDSVLSSTDVSGQGTPLANNTAGVIGFNAQNALTGRTDVYEVYGETFIPVLKDLPFVKEFNINAGYRYSDFNTVGSVSSYRADADWRVIDALRFRGGYSRAVRAPSVGELYAPTGQNFPTIGAAGLAGSGDPCDVSSAYQKGTATAPVSAATVASIRALCVSQGVPSALSSTYKLSNTQVQSTVGGNTALQQEVADTYTVGVVFSPKIDMPLFRRISASIDYYNIDVKGAVGTVDATLALQKCFNLDGSNPGFSAANQFCSLISRDPSTGDIININQQSANLAEYQTSGVDFQLDWAFGLGAVGLSDDYGSLAFNVIGTYLNEFNLTTLPGEPTVNYAGTIGNTTVSSVDIAHPTWKLLAGLTYSYGPVEFGARYRYIDSMDDANTFEKVPSRSYVDLNARWRINDTLEIRGGVNNLTDELPPTFTSNVQANTDPSTYDVIGRSYYVALKARF